MNVAAYAKLIDLHPGHVRRLCPRWAKTGKARLERGGLRKAHWMIRADDIRGDGQRQSSAAMPQCSEGTTVIAPGGSIIVIIPPGFSAGSGVLKAVQRGFRTHK
jgi:hypothetical protein